MRLPLAISSCLLLAAASLFATNTEFSENRTLSPLKLSAADLDTILYKAKGFIASANGFVEGKESARESVTLGVRGREITIPHFSVASSGGFPKELYKFAYRYNRTNGRISSVMIDLGDDTRRVSVTGIAEDQVKETCDLIEKDLLQFSTMIGGPPFRRVTGLFLTVVFLVFLGIGGAWWWRTRIRNALAMLLCSTVGLLLVFLLPWPRYLPGFALYQSYSPFFLIRHASQMFCLILLAVLAGIPLSYFLSRPRPRK